MRGEIMKIDIHNHIIPPAVLDLLNHDGTYGVTFPDASMRTADGFQFPLVDSFHDAKAKVEELAAHGLDGAVLSIAPPAFLYSSSLAQGEALCAAANEGLAKFTQSVPERFRWMAHVPLQQVDVAVAMLRAAKAQGAVGVEVGTNINGDRLDAPLFEAFWAAAQELELLVMLHPTNNAPYPGLADWYLQNAVGNPLETMIAGCRLICSGLLDRFPSIQILLVHGGGHLPYQLGRLRHAISVRKELTNVAPDPWIYAKRMNFDSLTHDAQALGYLVDRIGAGNIFVGTDLPFDMASPSPITTLSVAVGETQTKLIAETNPAVRFGFSQSESYSSVTAGGFCAAQ
jgi:aminocarboxymuconate-semialdehyde decarboxylase